MPAFFTRQFGLVEYTDDAVVSFDEGLPAFEHCRQFVLIERPETAPLIFLQSLDLADLCFLTLPAECIDPGYQLHLPPEEMEAHGQDVLCLAILTTPASGEATANLMAPVVIHRHTRKARQVIQDGSAYSFQHRLFEPEEKSRC